jgi:short-subunit dehydrogenase
MNMLMTGAAGGIGRPLCKLFAQKGYRMALVDLDKEGLEATAEAVRNLGAECSTYVVDVSDADSVSELNDKVIKEFGGIDLLINNVGTAAEGDFVDVPFEEVHKMMAVNYYSTVHMLQAFLPSMIDRGKGHVVNMASVAGLASMPTATSYSASKHAVVGLTEGLRGELKGRGIKVTLLCPSYVRTPIYQSTRVYGYDQGYVDSQLKACIEPDKAAEEIFRGIEKGKYLVIVGMIGKSGFLAKRISLKLSMFIQEVMYKSYQKYKS